MPKSLVAVCSPQEGVDSLDLKAVWILTCKQNAKLGGSWAPLTPMKVKVAQSCQNPGVGSPIHLL